MKTYEEITEKIIELINDAVVSSDEDKVDYLMPEAYALGWVIGVSYEDIKAIYDGELTKQYVLIKGREGGVAG